MQIEIVKISDVINSLLDRYDTLTGEELELLKNLSENANI